MRVNERHYEEEALLAWLDGEAGVWLRWRVERHMRRCWSCRKRAAELEETIQALRREGEAETPESRLEVSRAKWRFLEAARAYEESAGAPAEHRDWRGWWLSAAAAAVLVVGFFAWPGRRPEPVAGPAAPGRTQLEAAGAKENARFEKAVREDRFEVEFAAGPRRVSRELQVWSAPAEGLYASRWAEGKQTEFALYAAKSEPEYEYTREGGLRTASLRGEQDGAPLYVTVGASGEDLATLEAGFRTWIRSQVWRPVSLARELGEFESREHASLRLRQDGARASWESEAEWQGERVKLHLELDERQEPVLMRIERGRLSVTVRRTGRREFVNVSAAGTVFRPEPGGVAVPPARVWVPTAEKVPLMEAPRLLPGRDELDLAELQAWDVLHRARLCLTGELEVKREAGAVAVAGVMLGEDRRLQLQALMEAAPMRQWIRLEMAERPAANGRAAASTGRQARRAPAGEPWLRKQLRVGSSATERELFDVMNVVVRAAEDLSVNGFALRHLAERFPADREARMSEDERRLLRRIAEDHAIAAETQALVLGRVLTASDEPAKAAEPAGQPWQATALELQRAAARTAAEVLSLFEESAGGDEKALEARMAGVRNGLAGLKWKLNEERAQLRHDGRYSAGKN